MNRPQIIQIPEKHAVSPFLNEIGSHLALHNQVGMEQDQGEGWQLVERILSYAVEAEQEISEQHARIGYLESLATTDELTGLGNRRSLFQKLYRTLSHAQRHRSTGLVGYFDLDDFKLVNDTYGHEAGDAVLRHTAAMVANSIRTADFAARLGGDEFVIVLECKDLAAVGERLHQMRRRIESVPAVYRGVTIPIRMSLGIISFDLDSSVNEILSGADDAMYCDKRQRKARKLAS